MGITIKAMLISSDEESFQLAMGILEAKCNFDFERTLSLSRYIIREYPLGIFYSIINGYKRKESPKYNQIKVHQYKLQYLIEDDTYLSEVISKLIYL